MLMSVIDLAYVVHTPTGVTGVATSNRTNKNRFLSAISCARL